MAMGTGRHHEGATSCVLISQLLHIKCNNKRQTGFLTKRTNDFFS